MEPKRITILTGHYGSGKTNIAVNYAKQLAAQGKPVVVADLDIVNPYFRTADSKKDLEQHGIELICSAFANSNVDLPALPKELYAATENPDRYAVLDVGGDDRGAVALGRYVPAIRAENNYEMAFVVNFYRPLTTTPQDVLTVLGEVEAACGLPCTGLINNSNLGAQTTAGDVLATVERMRELSDLCGLPVLMTTVVQTIAAQLAGAVPNINGIQLQSERIA